MTRTLVIVLILIGGLRLATLGTCPLMDSTEGRYAEIGRQILTSGQWIMPHIEPGKPFWAKPPLSFWLIALSFKTFGLNEFAARFPAFLLSVCSVLLTIALGTRFYGTPYGHLAGGVLASTLLFYALAAGVLTDPALLVCILLSMAGFALALRADSPSEQRRWGYVFFIGLGLGLLAKGPVGWVLVLAPLTLWTLLQRRWAQVWRKLPWISGALITLAIGIPWHVLAERESPGFLHYYLVGEHWKRFTVPGWDGDLYGDAHKAVRGMMVLLSVVAAFPWVIVLVAHALACRSRGGRLRDALGDPWTSYLVLWLLTPVLFFSLSGNVIITYALPALPALALLVGGTTKRLVDDATRPAPWLTRPRTMLVVLLFVPVLGFLTSFNAILSHARNTSQFDLIECARRLDPEQRASIVYIGKMPYSAVFYTRGRTVLAPYLDEAAVQTYLQDDHRDFFVYRMRHEHRVPAMLLDKTEEVGRTGRWVIRRERENRG